MRTRESASGDSCEAEIGKELFFSKAVVILVQRESLARGLPSVSAEAIKVKK
jgi:hypothetical protein